MNASTERKKAHELSLTQSVLGLMGHYLGRRGLIVLALAAVGTGLYLSWGWLAAVGIAPLLLGLAPCAAMCALGLCMNKAGGKGPK
jgi:cadmium resistance protein CadD (predicted permease)